MELKNRAEILSTPLPRREGQGGGPLRQGGESLTIIKVGEMISPNMLQEDEQLLRYYDVATRHV